MSATKRYDRAYFDRWYRGRNRVSTATDVRRKVALAIAVSEYFLRRRLQSVLDVGCGEGAWFGHVKELRPRATYLGLDPSDYAVERFGAERHIRKAAFADIASMRLRAGFDLVVCSDALHYIADKEIRAGIPELARLAGGVLFLEVLTSEDDIMGDLEGLIRRPAAWYSRLFTKSGMTPVAPYSWLAPALREEASELESVSS